MGSEDLEKEHRLALLLADGTGDFDFVHVIVYDDEAILRGHVGSYQDKRRAEKIAKRNGFASVRNEVRVWPKCE